MRFEFDPKKSRALKQNPIRAIGWVGDRLITVIFEVREDGDGEYYWLITLWRSTKKERVLYEESH